MKASSLLVGTRRLLSGAMVVAVLLLFMSVSGSVASAQGVDAAQIKEIREAAEQGDANAQDNLGFMYANGEGVTQNYAEAVKWYRKAAEQGHPEAQFELGVFYHFGYGVAEDDVEAVKWYRKAAEQENVFALMNLAALYLGVSSGVANHAEAVKWFRKAADLGFAEAQMKTGEAYFFGEGVPPVPGPLPLAPSI
jgi:TPR repeat protein